MIKRAARDVIEIGEKLIEVKALLPHRTFSDWTNAEFDWGIHTARNFMRVAQRFGHEKEKISLFAPSALYLLAAPSTPESTRDEAVERAEAGEVITHAKAKSILAVHKSCEEPLIRVAPAAVGEPQMTNRWVDSAYRQIAQVRDTQDRRLIGAALSPNQLRKIKEIVDFLQDIETLVEMAMNRRFNL